MFGVAMLLTCKQWKLSIRPIETDFASLQAFKHFIAKADLSNFLTV
jgi:hypothetical protein